MELEEARIDGQMAKSADWLIHQANIIKLQEAKTNYTNYQNEMDPKILVKTELVTTYTDYYRKASKRNHDFRLYVAEIEGYMSILMSIFLGRDSVDKDFKGADSDGNEYPDSDLPTARFFEKSDGSPVTPSDLPYDGSPSGAFPTENYKYFSLIDDNP